jgi:GT2 family glycosyltransferase
MYNLKVLFSCFLASLREIFRVESKVHFSIVIPSHQRADLLKRCLASVERHAPAGTEVIVVDDASVGGIIATTARGFSGIQVLRLPRRRGFCPAVNTGIARAQGDVIELLNDDTEVQAGWAEPALEWFGDDTVGAVAPLVLWGPGGARVDSAGDRYFIGGVAGKRGHAEPVGLAHQQARPVFGASGSSAFYRRAALVRIGGFPDQFGAYFDDVDVAFRLQRAGYRSMFEPASRVLHHVSASYGRPKRRLLEQQSTNEERVFWRNLPGTDLARALPWHVAVLAAKAWRRWEEGTLVPFVCGRLRVLGEMGEMLRHRRRLRKLGPPAPVEKWRVETSFWKPGTPS